MRTIVFLAILALASAVPSFYNYQKDIRIDDDQIVISNGQGKRILIQKPTDEKTKQVEIVIAGQDGLTRKISIDKNMQVVKDVKSTENPSGLFNSHMVKFNSSKGTDNQFATLVVIFREYQGIINGMTYQQLLSKLHEAVNNGKIHEVVYEALKNFDTDSIVEITTSSYRPNWQNTWSQTQQGMVPTYPQQPSLYGQQYPMYNHQTVNWNQLSQQYGHNYVNQLPQEQYGANYVNEKFDYQYQYAQEMYQTVKQTLENLKQIDQVMAQHGQQDVQIQQELQQVQQLYNYVEQSLQRMNLCKQSPQCVKYFGKSWYAQYGQKMSVMNSGYVQHLGQDVYAQQPGLYGQLINGQQGYVQPIDNIDPNQMMLVDQLRLLYWQLVQKSQPLLQQLKTINQELLQLVTMVNQQQLQLQQGEGNAQWSTLTQQLQQVFYKLNSVVSQELPIQQQILQIHLQMGSYGKQIISNYYSVQDRTPIIQQQWMPTMQNNMMMMRNTAQWPVSYNM